MKIAVVAAKGLGDGLLALTLSHNFQLEGHFVTTFNTPLTLLKEWFPTHTLLPLPTSDFEHHFAPFDLILAADHSILSDGLIEKVMVLKHSHFDKKKTLVENNSQVGLKHFLHRFATKENGLMPLPCLIKSCYPKRVVLHPVSTEPLKTWPKAKFVKLARELKKRGYQPSLALSSSERQEWLDIDEREILLPEFKTLSEIASYIYESGFLIGNDSGLGHLASNLSIPTLSLFARLSHANLWRPGWGQNIVVTPYPLLLGAKMKHKYWKSLLTVEKVLRNFVKLSGCYPR